ncbi:MAG TPA: MFS transporter [Phenylobacterium sp.]|uniref:MFS transporter n=1 Tax=Phenylobacterium sp. TaxID=1871053 RepID=UPI002C9D95C3|nr:MFS transporter [Phenylobacterium sp.]HSV03474.1 MFS transporter [Phenylobacterium sp.]
MSSTSAATSGRLPFPRLLAFAGGSIGSAMLLGVMGVYLPRFYAAKMGISLLVIGGAIAVIRLTDLGVDLGLGWLMDKTKTPLGRFRPWYLAGLPVMAFAIFKAFNPPDAAGVGYLATWYFVLYASYSMLALSHAAWAGTLTGDYNERSRIFGWMLGLAVLGSVAVNLLPVVTRGRISPASAESLPLIGWMIIAITAITVPLAVLLAPERIAPVVKKEKLTLKDYLAVITTPSMLRLVLADLFLTLGPGTTAPLYVFFFHDAKGFSLKTQVPILLIPYIGAGLIGAPFWGRVAQKFGKHRTVQIGCVAYAIMQTMLMVIPAKLFWPTFAGMFAVGFTASSFVLLIRAMVADVADQLRLETGQERAGVLFALVTMTQKFGSSITVSIVYPILQAVGYDPKETAHNTPHAIWGLEMCYLFAPIILVMVGGSMFFGYNLTRQRQSEIRAKLEGLAAADVAAAEESLVGPNETIAAAQ